jgi:hypothetical protein
MPRLTIFPCVPLHVFILLILFCFAGLTHAASRITVRAIGPYFGENVVQFIAENTELQQLPLSLLKQDGLTPRKVITAQCGHENKHYVAQFLKMNSLAPDQLDAQGDVVTGAAWPACLHLRLNTQRKVEVHPGESYAAIYHRLTGSPGQPRTVAKFFSISDATLRAPLPTGKLLDYPHSTVEVTLRPRIPETSFIKGLMASVKKDGSLFPDVLKIVPPRAGEVLVSVPEDPESEASMRCMPLNDGPFHAIAVERAFKHAARNRSPGTARLLVIDNGFFGATDEEEEDADIFVGSPFPSSFFARQEEGKQPLALRANITATRRFEDQEITITTVEPVNPRGDEAPDAVSGHGTHVTGLTLGGPYFQEYRDKLLLDGRPWAEVYIMNVALGQRALLPNSTQEIFAALRLMDVQGAVVNMSFRFDADSDSINLFQEIHRSSDKTLFVVAAGNGGAPMSQGDVPAMLGGLDARNQITVAATHQSGPNQAGLTQFSNSGSDYVDIAAPGCAIESWISNTKQSVPLSGTSMAAPLVSFAASLIYSLHPGLPPGRVKARLLSSGDLLPSPREVVASQSTLNIAKALYLFDDYIEYDGLKVLGRIEVLPLQASQCDKGADVEGKGLWAHKKSPDGALLFHGKNLDRLKGICKGVAPAGTVKFKATHQVNSDGTVSALLVEPVRTIPLASVIELVFRLP